VSAEVPPHMSAGVYRVRCLSGCGEPCVTNVGEHARDEAAAHALALGHATRVVQDLAEAEIEARAAILFGADDIACVVCGRDVPDTAAADPAWTIRTMPVVTARASYDVAAIWCPACPAAERGAA
jgi:hypothetical protein